MSKILKTILVGAVVYVLPLTIVAILLAKVLNVVHRISAPIAALLPNETVFGVGVATLVSVLILLLACYFLGNLATGSAKRPLIKSLEDNLLIHIPGYILLRSWAHGVAGINEKDNPTVVLAWIEESWQMAFLIETLDNGLHTVFVPQAPSPFSGSIYYLKEERIHRLPLSFGQAARTVRRFGVGSKELLKGKF